jgi:NAD(P)-dependent dehydrogenase (short-subunit alcohol dehydrogenase family)
MTVVLTGPSRGLGRDTALALADRGCRLVLLGRPSAAYDEVAAEAARRSRGAVHKIDADFASVASVRSAARAVRDLVANGSMPAVNTVIGNAGLQHTNRRQITLDGLESTFGVNVVANHTLVTELLGALAPDAHVIIVGSGTHYGKLPATLLVAAPQWDDPSTLAQPGGADADSSRGGQRAYSTSKLAVNYLVNELQRRHGDVARFNVYDPGLMAGTGLARTAPPWKLWVWNNVMPKLTPVIPGMATTSASAKCLVRFALGDDHRDLRGGYVEIGKRSQASAESNDPAREAALWDACVQLTADH